MKSKPKVITVKKMVGDGISPILPSYLTVGQRHFEKEKPSGVPADGGRGFILPVDLVSLVLPATLTEGMESVEMVYRERAPKVGGKDNHD